jgi:hypothetical protein
LSNEKYEELSLEEKTKISSLIRLTKELKKAANSSSP